MKIFRSHVLVCGGTGCSSSNSALIREKFIEKIKEVNLDNKYR